MDTENLKKVKTLLGTSRQLATFFARFKEASSKESCDKYCASFDRRDDRFAVISHKVILTAYTGYYGSSSCSRFGSFSNELIGPYFDKALESHKDLILQTMANLMVQDAKSLADDARGELQKLSDMLDSAIATEQEVVQ